MPGLFVDLAKSAAADAQTHSMRSAWDNTTVIPSGCLHRCDLSAETRPYTVLQVLSSKNVKINK